MSRPEGAAPPIRPLQPGEPPLAILVDYDGTIALTDVSDTVMAEHVPGAWETEVAAYDAGRTGSRRLMELEMSLVDVPSEALFATAAAQPHDPGFVPFVRRAQEAGLPVEIVSDGFGFFIAPALEALGVGDLPVVTARTTFEGRRARIEFPNGNPTLLRVRDLQARPGPRPSSGGASRRVHRRWRERSLRCRIRRHRVGQEVARADLSRGGLGFPPLDGVPRDRGMAGRDSRRLESGSGDAAGSEGAAAVLRRGSVGRAVAWIRLPTRGRRPASPSAPSARSPRTAPSRA